MLDGFPGPRHVHAVGQVGPPQLGVAHLLLQHLVGAEPHNPWDVIILHINTTSSCMVRDPGQQPAGVEPNLRLLKCRHVPLCGDTLLFRSSLTNNTSVRSSAEMSSSVPVPCAESVRPWSKPHML